MATGAGINFGGMFINVLSANIIPLQEEGPEKLQNDQNWRIVFGFPIILEVMALFFLFFFFPNPSLKDSLRILPDEEAKRELSKIYKLENPEDFSLLKAKLLAETSDDQTEEISQREAYCGKKYRCSSWNAIALTIQQ